MLVNMHWAELGEYDELSDQMKWVNWESQIQVFSYCSAQKSDQVTDYINPIKLVLSVRISLKESVT